MRNFFKQNLLAIAVCMTVVATLGSATTITRPYTSSDYAGGQKAVGAKVNAEFQSIVNWLNGANIDSTNLAVSGVASTNIASGAVTPSKLSALNYKITDTSSLYSLTGTVVPAVVTNLSTTFTSNGRPARISLVPNTSQYMVLGTMTWGSGILPVLNNAGSIAGFFVKDGSTTAHYVLDDGLTATDSAWKQCSSFSYVETSLTSGQTYTFAFKASITPSTQIVYVVNCRLVVEEL